MNKHLDVYIEELTQRGRRHAKALLKGYDGEEDIANDAIISLLNHPNPPSDKKELFKLFDVILHRRWADHVDKVTRGPIDFSSYEESVGVGDVLDLATREEKANTIAKQGQELIAEQVQTDIVRAVDRLPQQQRAVFWLRHREDMKIRETAEILGIASGTVKAHEFRARATLAKALKALKGFFVAK